MKLKTRPVTTSQEPQISTAARRPSVRGARRVPQSSTPRKKSAAGRSQEICVPISEPKSRVMPVEPHMLPPAPPPAPVPVPKTAADDAAALVAGDPAEAVVAEDQVQDAVVLRAADVGPARRGPERRRSPPTSRPPRTSPRPRRAAARAAAGSTPAPRAGRRRRSPGRRRTPAASSSGSRSRSGRPRARATECAPCSSARVSA